MVKLETPLALLVVTLTATAVGCGESRTLTPAGPSSISTPAAGTPAPPPSGAAAMVTVAGTISDATWRRLFGATVTVVDGPQAGLSARTNANGEFTLTGAFDETTQFRAAMEGYVATVKPFPARCERCHPNWWLHFYLESTEPTVDITGDYTLTFTATCSAVPDEFRSRSYAVTVTPRVRPGEPANSWFDVAIASGKFVERHNGFEVRVAGNRLAIDIGDWGHGYPGLVEEIGPQTYLLIGGEFRTIVTDTSNIAGSFVGAIERCSAATDSGEGSVCSDLTRLNQFCSHRLALTRAATSPGR